MKNILRKNLISKRNSLTSSSVYNLSNSITDNVLSVKKYLDAKCIFIYLDFNNEVKTNKIIQHALNMNKRVFVPICNVKTKQLITAEIKDFNHLQPNKYGILEPKEQFLYIVNRELIDLAIVPGIAFDSLGNRLGFGAGYYDRFFSSTSKNIYKIAIAYSFQVIEELEAEAHDVPMDTIITENKIINCNIKGR